MGKSRWIVLAILAWKLSPKLIPEWTSQPHSDYPVCERWDREVDRQGRLKIKTTPRGGYLIF